jgi:hypothetical protein
MNSILTNWNFFRGLRLVAGVTILVYGYTDMDWPLILLGSMFAFMAITNSQCGPFSNSCNVVYKEKDKDGSA